MLLLPKTFVLLRNQVTAEINVAHAVSNGIRDGHNDSNELSIPAFTLPRKFYVCWVRCCSRDKDKCCLRPIILVNEYYDLHNLLESGPGNSQIFTYFALWIEVDGRVYDPHNTKEENDELPRLTDKDPVAIASQETRAATLLQYKSNLAWVDTDVRANIDSCLGIGEYLPTSYNRWLILADLHRCGALNHPVCFPNDGKNHTIRLGAQRIKSVHYAPQYEYREYYDATINCEPCTYKISKRQERIDNKFGPPKCRLTVRLDSNGGLNGKGCVGGFEFLRSGVHGGRWWNGDDTTNLRYYNLPAPPIQSGAILSVDFSGVWSDVVRLYDVCGNLLADVPISASCYEVDKNERIPELITGVG